MGFTPFGASQTITGNVTITGTETVNGFAALQGGGLSSSVFQFFGGTDSSVSAPLITPTNANGAAAQLSDTGRDYMIYLTIGTAGTALSVAIGPTAGVADTIYTAATATAGQTIAFRLPRGWFWKWAATTATLAEQTAIGC